MNLFRFWRETYRKHKIACLIVVWSFVIILSCSYFLYVCLDISLLYINKSCVCSFFRHESPRVLIVGPYPTLGEHQAAIRMSNALERLGYTSICSFNDILSRLICLIFDIDVSIAMQKDKYIPKSSYKCFVCHLPSAEEEIIHLVDKYDVLLSAAPFKRVKNVIKDRIKVIPFYLSACSTDFYDSTKNQIFYCGDPWDSFRTYGLMQVYKKLDKTNYFNIYGAPKWKLFKFRSYRRFIGMGEDSMLNTMRSDGVSLIFHSVPHFEANIPTARIFEATAASNVVITDRLPFITENFKDSVLYVDRNVEPEELFRQIDRHMQWILSHPKEAKELALRSHQVFVKKFTMEEMMRRVMNAYMENAVRE